MNLIILGVTGSIGTQTLDIVRNNPRDFKVLAVTGNSNIKKMTEIIEEFNPSFVSMGTKKMVDDLCKLYPNIEYGFGVDGLVEASIYPSKKDVLVINSVVGSVGLIPTVKAIKASRNIALANKETLVIGGEIIKPLLKEFNVSLIPIDSEHSAIMQCLNGESSSQIDKLIITASGGSFRDKKRSELNNCTVSDALSHPNWSMGAKITIDSATMMNKGLEVIEAHYLFDVSYEKIDTIMHKESIIHSMVMFKDSSIIAHLGSPDMRIPINYALYYPKRTPFAGEKLDFKKLGSLNFEELSYDRYPLLKMAIDAGKEKGLKPTILNAANEAAVSLFLNGKITFLEIEEIVRHCLYNFENDLNIDLNKVLEKDLQVKDYVLKKYS